jgi:hypothetical protein
VNGVLDVKFGSRIVRVEVAAVGGRLHLRFPYHAGMVDEARAMEGARWDPNKKQWSADYCDRNLLQLMLLTGQEPKEFLRYLEAPPQVMPKRDALKPHQLRLLSKVLHCRRVIVAAHMGTGKTLVAIEALEAFLEKFPGSCLYVGRKTPLEATRLEFRKWRAKVDPGFVTFDSLGRLLENWTKGAKAPRAVIFDESQNLKSETTKRFEAARHLTKAMRQDWDDDHLVLEMTGTPQPKDYVDWWSQCELAYPGWLRESNGHKLRKRLANFEKVDGPYGVFPKFLGWKEREVENLSLRLRGLVEFVSKGDADLKIPDPVYEEVQLPVEASVMNAARLLAMTTNSGAQLLDKLRQLSDGFQYGEGDEVSIAEGPKDVQLRLDLDRFTEGGRVGVYAAYTASIDKVVEIGVKEGWAVLRVDGRGMHCFNTKKTPQDLLMAFQERGSEDDKLLFVGQPGAGGVGLNLQGIGCLIYYSNSFNGGDRQQSEARPQRPGNLGLTIIDYIHLPTDRLVINNLKQKKDAQDIVLADIKGALQ